MWCAISQSHKTEKIWQACRFLPVILLLALLTQYTAEFLAPKPESRILGQSYTPVCGFSMMEQVRLCAV